MDLNLGDSDTSDDVVEQASQVIEQIEQSWINEKFAPEILPENNDAIECLLEQIQHIEENLPKLSRDSIQRSLHQLEVDRLRFLISSYLRNRLEKIENYYDSIVNDESRRVQEHFDTYLTDNELKFAKDFKSLNDQCFNDSLKGCLGSFSTRQNQEKSQIVPNLNSFVFVSIDENLEGVKVCDQFVDFKAGTIQVLPYISIMTFLKLGKVHLI